jgi:hypothetical protein
VAPRVPPDGLVGVRLLFSQAHTCGHKLPTTGAYADDCQHRDALQTVATFPSQRPVARRTPATLHGRLHVHGQLVRGSSTATRPRRDPTTPTRPPAQPRQRHVAAHTGGQPPWPYSRPPERRISSPYRQATSPRQASFSATRSRGDYRSLATRQTTRGIRRKGAIPLPLPRPLVSFCANYTAYWLLGRDGADVSG